MNKIFKRLAPVAVIAASIGAVIVLNATKPEAEKSTEPVRPVALFVDKVKTETLQLKVETHGEVAAKTEVDVVAQVSGVIVSVSEEFIEGGSFTAAQPLLQIEDADYRIALLNAKAALMRQQTLIQQIQADADVARRQLEGRKATALGLKKPQIAEAFAALEAAKANVQLAELNLQRTRVAVPFSGRVRHKLVDVGQFVAKGQPLARVFSTDVAQIRLPLTDTQLATLGLPIGYSAVDQAAPDVEFSAVVAGELRHWYGSLVRIEASADPGTRMLYGIAEVIDPYGNSTGQAGGMPLAVGLYVSASIDAREAKNASVIPRTALRSSDKVYVVRDNKLEIRQVDVAYRGEEVAVITQGVEPGESVVVSPVRDPLNGMRVEPLEQQYSQQQAVELALQGAES